MAEAEAKSNHVPSFFKVLVHGKSTKLKLPPLFMRDNIGWHLQETISLISAESGMSWKVEMETDETGGYFTEGWAEFFKDMGLQALDFLVFRLIRDKEFEVTAYGEDGCLKDVSSRYASNSMGYNTSRKPVAHRWQKVEEIVEEGIEGNGSGNPLGNAVNFSFQKRLAAYDRKALSMPMGISRVLELGTTRKSLMIKDPQQKLHPVEVKVRKSSRNGQVYTGKGWRAVLKANRLDVGDTVELEFLGGEGDMVALRVVAVRRRRE